jgi:hypothetical protein
MPSQADTASAFETWRQSEVARLQRDRRVLEKQSKAILKVRSSLLCVLLLVYGWYVLPVCMHGVRCWRDTSLYTRGTGGRGEIEWVGHASAEGMTRLY